jgi:hypothetical protein
MHIVVEEHYKCTKCQHSTPFILNSPTQVVLMFYNTLLPLLWSLVTYNSTISTLFLSQKTVALIVLWYQRSQMKPRFHELFIHAIHQLCVIALESKRWRHSLHFVPTHGHFQNPSCTKLVAAKPLIILHRTVYTIYENLHHRVLVNTLDKLTAHSLQMASQPLLSLWAFVFPSLNSPCHCLTVLSLITFLP